MTRAVCVLPPNWKRKRKPNYTFIYNKAKWRNSCMPPPTHQNSTKRAPLSLQSAVGVLFFASEEMVFSLVLHIHTGKSNFFLSLFEKHPVFGMKKDEKRGFQPILGRSIRPVAQNFSQKQEFPILLPFMSKNGIFLPKTPLFFAKMRFFLCKLSKKAVFSLQKAFTGG